MSKTVTFKVEGLKELREALLALPVELQAGPLRKAVKAAAVVVKDRAAQNAPVDDGTLKRAIYTTRNARESSAVRETHIVGIRYGKRYRRRGLDAWYWWFLEFGTSKLSPRPFMRPAFESTRTEQVEAMRTTLKEGIERVAEKLRRNWNRSMGRRPGKNA